MTVSKRLRYEILARDGHACRYCGGISPDVVLQVDHVIPVALGGTDVQSNLVAACRDCNIGKAASSANRQQIEDVSDDAVRWGNAMEAAYEDAVSQIELMSGYVEQFSEAWGKWHYASNNKPVPLPDEWERSVEKWYGLGLPLTVLLHAIKRAMVKTTVVPLDKFRYMAGIIWRTHEELTRQVAAMMAAPKEQGPADVNHCEGPWCGDIGGDGCPECGAPHCEWLCGYRRGFGDGKQLGHAWGEEEMWRSHGYALGSALRLSRVCDGRILDEMGVKL